MAEKPEVEPEQGSDEGSSAAGDAASGIHEPSEDTLELQSGDEVHFEEEFQDHHEERGPSLSSRILTWLAVLVFGMILALWGGPRIAPNLPEWASPLVPYLSPGGDKATTAVSNLRTDVEARFAEISSGPSEEEIRETVDGLVAERLAAVSDEIQSEIGALRDTVSASDGAEIEARIATLETRIEGIGAQLATLQESMLSAVENGGAVNAQASSQLSANQAEIEGLKAELAALAGKTGGLTQRIDDVEAAAQRMVGEAQEEAERVATAAHSERQTAAFSANVAAIGQAVARGSTFIDNIDQLRELGVENIPQILTEKASVGVSTIDELRAEFGPLAHAAIKATIRDEGDDGSFSKLGSFFKSQMATRSLEPIEGDSANAVLSRVNAALENDDLDTVLSEAAGLQEPAKGLLGDWVAKVEDRRDILSALAQFDPGSS